MSAYLVEDKTISRVVTAFVTHHHMHDSQLEEIRLEVGLAIDVLPTDRLFPVKLAKAMLLLNVKALQARYPDDWQEFSEFVGPIWNTASTVQTLKSLNCWLYQCSEGDIPENSPLYAAFKKYEHFLEREIVQLAPIR